MPHTVCEVCFIAHTAGSLMKVKLQDISNLTNLAHCFTAGGTGSLNTAKSLVWCYCLCWQQIENQLNKSGMGCNKALRVNIQAFGGMLGSRWNKMLGRQSWYFVQCVYAFRSGNAVIVCPLTAIPCLDSGSKRVLICPLSSTFFLLCVFSSRPWLR